VNATVFISILVGFDAVECPRRVAQMDTCEYIKILKSLPLHQMTATGDTDLTHSIE
jgi:hypothetical protein